MADFEFHGEDETPGVLGTPEGDGDFESDNLASTNETSGGGQINTGEAERVRRGEPGSSSREDVPGPQRATGVERAIEKAIDQVSSGKIQP